MIPRLLLVALAALGAAVAQADSEGRSRALGKLDPVVIGYFEDIDVRRQFEVLLAEVGQHDFSGLRREDDASVIYLQTVADNPTHNGSIRSEVLPETGRTIREALLSTQLEEPMCKIERFETSENEIIVWAIVDTAALDEEQTIKCLAFSLGIGMGVDVTGMANLSIEEISEFLSR